MLWINEIKIINLINLIISVIADWTGERQFTIFDAYNVSIIFEKIQFVKYLKDQRPFKSEKWKILVTSRSMYLIIIITIN